MALSLLFAGTLKTGVYAPSKQSKDYFFSFEEADDSHLLWRTELAKDVRLTPQPLLLELCKTSSLLGWWKLGLV